MSDEEMVISIVAIGCSTGVFWMILNTIRAVITGRQGRGGEALVTELRELREEIRRLRQQNNELILGFDTTLQRVDQRIDHLERRAVRVEDPQPARLGRGER